MSRVALAVAALVAMGGAARAEAERADAPALSSRITVPGGTAGEVPRVLLGARFTVTVTALPRPGVEVICPTGFAAAGFEVLAGPRRTQARGVRLDCPYELVAWELGARAFPGVPISYVVAGERRQARSTPLPIDVVPTVADPGQAELAPIASPVAVLVRDLRLLWLAAGLLALGLVALVVLVLVRRARRRRARRRLVVHTRALSAEEQALARLRALGASALLDGDDLRPVYFEATFVVREYLGRRFGFAGGEMTTAETLAATRRALAPAEVQRAVVGLLETADPIKYAAGAASRADAAQLLVAAIGVVERARDPEEPRAQP